MPANHQNTLTERFRESLEQAQSRLTNIEEEAQKMVQDVLDRSRASRKEVSNILARLNSGELIDPKTVKEWQGKAKHVSADLAHRFDELRSRAIAYAGVASREQVEEVARDLDKLSRKIDRLLSAKRNSQKQ
jgi:predicted transcriptional regulator